MSWHSTRNASLLLVALLCVAISKSCCDTPPIIDPAAAGLPAAFGDFDSDKLTDVFVINDDQLSFSIHRAYKNEPLLRPEPKWRCNLPKDIAQNEVSTESNCV